MLELMGLPQPTEMSGHSLIVHPQGEEAAA